MLVALNMAERTAAPQRAGSLFKLSLLLDQYQQQQDSGNSSSSGSSSSSSSGSGEGSLVSVSAVTTIIQHLGDTWQLPHEKRVAETGVKYPIKTFRRKTAEDTVNAYVAKRQKERKELAEKQQKQSSSGNSDSNNNSTVEGDGSSTSSSALLPHAGADSNSDDNRLTQEEFQGLLLGSMVCAWAECYRHIP